MRLISYILHKRYKIRQEIMKATRMSSDHLTPEMKLRLITPNTALWTAKPEECSFVDPFWAFYWAGGQVLARYILDNKAIFKNQNVIDIGSGCGAIAIAASIAGAKTVYANDIDIAACEAISINAKLNQRKVHIVQNNLIKSNCELPVDIILVGDMLYDEGFAMEMFLWLIKCKSSGATVFIGDPGRAAFATLKKIHKLEQIFQCTLLPHTVLENNGFSSGSVWKLCD